MLNKMCTKRMDAGDCHTPVEAAKMFYAVMTASDDAEFAGTKWNIVNMFNRFGASRARRRHRTSKAASRCRDRRAPVSRRRRERDDCTARSVRAGAVGRSGI